MLSVNTSHLEFLLQRNRFVLGDEDLVFFGFRGALPLSPQDSSFASSHRLTVTPVDYTHPRCTLAQWRRKAGVLALFPGSTVPHRKHVAKALGASGAGANQMMTGFYLDYRKGRHLAQKPTGHDAFVQASARPIRRTADDLDYDNLDPFEVTNPGDNLHAAWSAGVDHDTYGSAGCQVVVGYPKCERRGNKPAVGAWKVFKANAYAVDQKRFPYALLGARELEQAVLAPEDCPVKLRFGSRDPLVSRLQAELRSEAYYEGDIDEDFGPRTHRAVMTFQEDAFGPGADDGIAGPMVGEALGINWPATNPNGHS